MKRGELREGVVMGNLANSLRKTLVPRPVTLLEMK